MPWPIKSPRLSLRQWTAEDRKSAQELLCDPDVMRFSDTGALDQQAVDAWLKSATAAPVQNGLPTHLAIEQQATGEVIGYLSHIRDLNRVASGDVEIGFRLVRSAWRKGYATEAVEAICAALKQAEQDRRIVAIVDPNNKNSLRVLQKIGMQFEREIMFEGYDYPDHLYVLTLQ